MAVANTPIEWTDSTWSPVTGCTEVSPGCDHCYAKTIAERFRGHAAFPHGFDVQVKAERVNDPLKWRKPRRIFVNSMSDLFHADIDRTWIAEIYAVMAAARRHTFQVLTKRAARMRTLLDDPAFADVVRARALGKGLPETDWQWPLPNVWLGVSVENQQWANIRIPQLLMTPAAVRFLSCEPLLGPVDLTRVAWAKGGGTHLDVVNGRHGVPGVWSSTAHAVDWVIVGGESGRGARPMHPRWAQTLRDQCQEAGVPYFYKQWGEWSPDAPLDDEGHLLRGKRGQAHQLAADGTLYAPGDVDTPDSPRYWKAASAGHASSLAAMYRVGKKTAGRLLDGREHNAFPTTGAVTA
jgi:protein gp37